MRDRLAAETSLAAPPTVELRDRLVVWSVATQRFDEVHVGLPGLELKELGPGVRADVDLVLRNVTASERFTRYVAGSLTGSTRFSWAQVSAVVGQQITPAAGGRVALSYAFTIAGVKVTAQVSAKPDLDPAGALFLADPQVVVAVGDGQTDRRQPRQARTPGAPPGHPRHEGDRRDRGPADRPLGHRRGRDGPALTPSAMGRRRPAAGRLVRRSPCAGVRA